MLPYVHTPCLIACCWCTDSLGLSDAISPIGAFGTGSPIQAIPADARTNEQGTQAIDLDPIRYLAYT